METINHQKPESDQQLDERLNKEVATFFETKLIEHKVVMHDSWDDLAEKWSSYKDDGEKVKAPNWLVGFAARNDTVHILSPSIMPAGREKNGTLRFSKTLKHELGHLYIRNTNSHSPTWLNEGICQLMAEQIPYESKKLDKITVKLLYEIDESLTDGRIYPVGKYIVDQIMENYGKETLLELIVLKDKDAVYAKLKEMFSWLV